MGTHIFNFHTIRPHQTRQISTFPHQPKSHHAFSCRSVKLRQRSRWQKLSMKGVSGGGDQIPEAKRKDEMKRKDDCEGTEDNNNNSEEDVNEKVELTEMEAIMGKDDGREPMDYKRRAGIFYKSSQVFQGNRDQHHHCA